MVHFPRLSHSTNNMSSFLMRSRRVAVDKAIYYIQVTAALMVYLNVVGTRIGKRDQKDGIDWAAERTEREGGPRMLPYGASEALSHII